MSGDAQATDREARLAELLDQLTQALRGGGGPDIEQAAARHPDLAAELRELWSAAMLAEDVTHLSSAGRPVIGNSDVPASPFAGPGRRPPAAFDDFEILGEVGRGGMGVVYKARQRSLDRTVALKMMLRGELASESEMERFRGEAEAAARLEHPHIVPVHEVGVHDGMPYFTMRFVEGTTLARRLSDGPLPPREAAALLLPVCRAIDYAHGRGVLHRDLKPSNILLDAHGMPHVTDFGLARRIEAKPALTQTGAVLGTPSYMAPEQAAGSRGDLCPATDVYSLGAVLYHALTGRPPFQAATPVDTVLMVLEQDPPLPRVLNPAADPDLEMIALKCLQKPADLRYPRAAALADDLDAYLAGEPIAARSTGVLKVMSRVFRETHHAAVLENWGLLWMWHSLQVFLLCVITNALHWSGVTAPLVYIALWSVGLVTWAAIFWALRRRGGPITFVERQIAHVWAASIIASIMLFFVEIFLALPVLTLSPVLALIGGMGFFIKAGILSGKFYFQASALFATAAAMALFPSVGLTLFGLVSAGCFFLPGLKYHRQRNRALAPEAEIRPGASAS
ncbi:MAG: serine/threonine protein kinase [Planctomycetes bacterium]|nr:serine/threonine protein kinase [Planctomycetota bacterium]